MFQKAAEEYAEAERRNSQLWSDGGGGGGSLGQIRVSPEQLWALYQYWLGVYRAQESTPPSDLPPEPGPGTDPDAPGPEDF
jgi:hypothetical protein